MQFLKDNKMYVGLIILALLGVWAYFTFFGGSGPSATVTVDETSPLSQDVLVTLSNLHTIKLDSTIFSDPVFSSLTDYGVAIPPENVGRRNPFAPL
ncbi:MAG TPA: hypothetical protein VHD31_01165 [Candidatus Paceibacterota bacterium]|nr:hypothetical protein [Candidatus Paceibacterota bacterium]